MPEILTESFCERCGTRYTFESATPRGPRLKGLKVMSRGLKNFVLSDDTSMDEAMAAARNETDREQTAQQLDAFHKTFNFCMSCRQYTCGNCWNEADGRCLSCAPHLGHEVLQAPFGSVGAGGAITLTDSEAIGLHDRNGHEAGAPAPAEPMAWPEPEPMAWPTSDLIQEEGALGPSSFQEAIDAAAELEADAARADAARADAAPVTEDVTAPVDAVPFQAQAEAEVVEELEAPAMEAAPSPVEETVAPPLEREREEVAPVETPVAATPPAAPIETVPPVPSIADEDRAAAAAANTSDLLQRFRPGQSLDDEIAAYERAQAAATGAAMAAAAEAAAAEADIAEATARAAAEAEAARRPQPEPEVAAAPRPEPVAAMPEPVAPMPEPEPEPVAAMPEPEPAPEPVEVEPAAAAWPEPVAAEPRDDVVYQPTWQIVAPEPPAADHGPVPEAPVPTGPTTEPIAASAEPQWPNRPEWPRPPSAEGLPFLGRPGAASGGIEALWAESAREVASVGPLPGTKPAGGVQPCVSCGLSLSANARFCRRCGTRQG
jgi:hypothetical protein